MSYQGEGQISYLVGADVRECNCSEVIVRGSGYFTGVNVSHSHYHLAAICSRFDSYSDATGQPY